MSLAHITSKYRAELVAKSYTGWLKNGTRVLDVGCGTGIVGNYLQNKLGLSLVGCDIDEYLAEKIPFAKMRSPTKLPFAANQFGYAMFNDVLHHAAYPDQIKLLREASRVANKVLIFELKPALVGKISDFLINKVHNPKMNIPFTYRSEKGWGGVFKSLGFKYQARKVKTPVWYPFSHVAFKVSR